MKLLNTRRKERNDEGHVSIPVDVITEVEIVETSVAVSMT